MNSKTTTQTPKKTNKPVFFNVNTSPYGVHYRVGYGDLEIYGNTTDRIFYEETVERIISAPREPPKDVYKMVDFVVKHITSAIAEFGSDYVAIGMSTEVVSFTKLTLYVYLTYIPDDDVWRGSIEATLDGHDGPHSTGVHTVARRVEFSGDIDVEVLRREIIRVARHAYNAYSKE